MILMGVLNEVREDKRVAIKDAFITTTKKNALFCAELISAVRLLIVN